MGLLCDTAGLGLVLGQVIGRWGNFFNREAFGGYTDGLFAMQLPLSAVRSSDVTTDLMNHVVESSGISYIPPWLALASIGFAVLVGMVAGYFPALRAMRLSPLAAIRNE